MFEITTSTGARYIIDVEDSFWRKIHKDGREDPWERIWSMKYSTTLNDFPWNDPKGWTDGVPEVGSHLYIGSKNVWWLSTKIVSVVETPGAF